jgi:hypothetical protein
LALAPLERLGRWEPKAVFGFAESFATAPEAGLLSTGWLATGLLSTGWLAAVGAACASSNR